jgi:outer membrane protein OmpA-like peptidoglycan-associated protein
MRTLSTLMCMAGFVATASAEDCQLGQRYMALAHDRVSAAGYDEALVFLRRAVEACPTYDAYEELGELSAQSSRREDEVAAVDAFIAAQTRATTPQERARSLYQYAALLRREGDAANAHSVIDQARLLDPADPEISSLANAIDQQLQSPAPEHVVRALRFSLYQPIPQVRPTPASVATARDVPWASKPSGADGRESVAGVAKRSPQSIEIPINFKAGSVVVDRETRDNIDRLAHALADPALVGHTFTFIGHADPLGSDPPNPWLARERAQAISLVAASVEPSLQGRIRFEGRGARQPLSAGSDEDAQRANRRLEVLVR